MAVKVVQSTGPACEELARICDTALGYPLAGSPLGGGIYGSTPSTWNAWGSSAPHGWTRSANPIYWKTAADAWYQLDDATGTAVANSGLVSAGDKATVAAVLAGRVSVADPSEAHTRTPRSRVSRALRVFCDGDSWTTGSTTAPTAFHSWRTQLQVLALAEPTCPGLDFVGPVNSGDCSYPLHNGLNGTGIASHNGATLATNLATYWPDVIIFFLGTNDSAAPIVVSDYTTYITDVHAARPTTKILWTTQPDLFSNANLANFIAAIPGAAASLISGDPTLSGKLVTHDFTGVITAGDTSASHPTTAGYDLLAASLWPKFKTLIGI